MKSRKTRRALTWVATAGISLWLAACEPTAESGGEDAERAALATAADGLRASLESTGATPENRASFDALVTDVRNRQSQGRLADIRIGDVSTPVGDLVAAPIDDGDGPDACADCPGYTIDGDRICLLESEGDCDPDDIIGRVCVYRCIWIGATLEAD